jgi:hypothetical protein
MRTPNIILIIVFSTYLLMAGCSELPSGFADEENIELQGLTQSDPPLAAAQAAMVEQGKWKAFEVLQTNEGPPPPFETRFSGNTRHDLNVQVKGVLDGDIVGAFTATINARLHLHPEKEGIFTGPVRLVGTWSVTELFSEPVTGTFEVTGHGHRELPGPFTGNLRARGTGDLKGMKLQASFEPGPAPATFVIKGRILDP